ncbi:thermonuclease family protein [Paracoccus sp. PAR01]|uniref:thermonuclease family protein n=1 Tax=Paracoccus sp. PAR01 TaxID=2769282 RepID=UPI001CE2107D|nr:thermonuclease family protein [Paracoccus sp. PAR01]
MYRFQYARLYRYCVPKGIDRLERFRIRVVKRLGLHQLEVIYLVLFIAVVLAVLLGRKGSKKSRSTKEQPRTPRENVIPFDAGSAKPIVDRRILEGSAFVIDGDTLVIRKTQIRLFGIDAAELNHPYGKNAKWALTSLCKGETIRAELIEQDVHGRTVAKCSLRDGRDLSAEMVKLGLALDWAKFSGGKYRSLETPDARKKLWLADARQKGRMAVWEQFDAKQAARNAK